MVGSGGWWGLELVVEMVAEKGVGLGCFLRVGSMGNSSVWRVCSCLGLILQIKRNERKKRKIKKGGENRNSVI